MATNPMAAAGFTAPGPAVPQLLGARGAVSGAGDQTELRRVFNQFVGETFYQQMLGALRRTVDKPAYFHGGRAEEVFQGQLDQVLSERMTEATADEFTGPMFELFMLTRR